MFILKDTFNDRVVSRHRKLENAIQADRKFQQAVKKVNGQNSYIPTSIFLNGKKVSIGLEKL